MNTLGAICGTLLAGLVLIELVGLTGALVVGAVGSATAGIAALLLDRREPGRATMSDAGAEVGGSSVGAVRETAGGRPQGRSLALAIAFVSGLTSLGYQLLWTRLLASGSGNTTYVFTLILSVFLVGIAVGAALVSRRMTTLRSPVAVIGVMQLVVAAIVLAGMAILAGLAPEIPFIGRVLLVVLPATLAMGITLPLASGLLGGADEGIGRDAGLVLGANTLGAIGGTFVVPFVLIPAIGSLRAVVLLALVNVGLGLGLLLRGRDARPAMRRATSLAAAALAIVAVAGLILPNPFVMDPGATRLQRESLLLASAEDEIAAVQAGGPEGGRRLLVGGTGMTRLTVDAKLMAYLPLITRPESKEMLVIAFGMGSTYRSGLIAGLEVAGVELVPSVRNMFGFFYGDADAVLADPSGQLIITDGRNYVELTDRTFDIIVVDPPPPIESSGTSVLYSREFYAASAKRLRPGGVMMEWMPYQQSVAEFRSHVRTFADVFPNVLIAFGPAKRGVYMLGSGAPVAIDPTAVRAILSRDGVLDDLVATDDAPVTSFDEWADVIDHLGWIDDGAVRAFGDGAPLILDDRPVTEYFLLRRAVGPSSPVMNEPNLRAATPR
jgi:spermidine synthase